MQGGNFINNLKVVLFIDHYEEPEEVRFPNTDEN